MRHEVEREVTLPVAHPFILSVPRESSGLPLLVALHGYAGDMTSMLRVAQSIAGDAIAVAAVQGLHQFWFPSVEQVQTRKTGFGWLTDHRPEASQARHHRLIESVVDAACRETAADRRKVFLMGFSQACALNYRFAFTHPGALRGVIGVCGGIPGDFADAKYVEIPAAVLHIAAEDDEYYSAERTRPFADALGRLARDVTFREYPGPHVFPRAAIPFIRDWILDRCSR
jgi:predicted esterase